MNDHASITLNALVRAASDERPPSRAAAARGLGALAAISATTSGGASPYLSKLMPVLSKLLRDAVIEVRYAATRAFRVIIHAAGPSEMSIHFESFMNVLAECAVADKSSEVRHQAERAVYRAFNLQNGMDEALEHLRAGGTAHGARGRLSDIALRALAALPDERRPILLLATIPGVCRAPLPRSPPPRAVGTLGADGAAMFAPPGMVPLAPVRLPCGGAAAAVTGPP